VLLELVRRPEPNARLAAVQALGPLADEEPAARSALEAATDDPDKRVRLMAKSALGRLEGPRKEDWPDW
jgi:HEAT repeat protein